MLISFNVMNIIDDTSKVLQQPKETLRNISELMFEFPKDGGIVTGLLEMFDFVKNQKLLFENTYQYCYDYFRHSYRMVISEEKAITNCPQTSDEI